MLRFNLKQIASQFGGREEESKTQLDPHNFKSYFGSKECVLLLSQISVNSMAIIRMRSSDTFGRLNSAGSLATSTVEQ
ncbi:hypothetical protein Tco_0845292, partial [Tanacetum coccineum]